MSEPHCIYDQLKCQILHSIEKNSRNIKHLTKKKLPSNIVYFWIICIRSAVRSSRIGKTGSADRRWWSSVTSAADDLYSKLCHNCQTYFKILPTNFTTFLLVCTWYTVVSGTTVTTYSNLLRAINIFCQRNIIVDSFYLWRVQLQ